MTGKQNNKRPGRGIWILALGILALGSGSCRTVQKTTLSHKETVDSAFVNTESETELVKSADSQITEITESGITSSEDNNSTTVTIELEPESDTLQGSREITWTRPAYYPGYLVDIDSGGVGVYTIKVPKGARTVKIHSTESRATRDSAGVTVRNIKTTTGTDSSGVTKKQEGTIKKNTNIQERETNKKGLAFGISLSIFILMVLLYLYWQYRRKTKIN